MEFKQNISYRLSLQILTSSFLFGVLLCVSLMAIKWIKKLFSLPIWLFVKLNNRRVDVERMNKQNDDSHPHCKQNKIPKRENLFTKTKRMTVTQKPHKTSRTQSTPRVSYVNVQSKYMFTDRMSPKFKDYLHKSNKPFLGYVSQTKDRERATSYFY